MSSDEAQMICRHAENVAAYLDGELSIGEEAEFETHLRGCPSCANQTREQRGVLCALSVMVEREKAMPLPRDFSRIVTARARTDLRGARSRQEQRRALKVCSAFAPVTIAFALVWLSNQNHAVIKIVGSLSGVLARVVRDVCAGLMLLWRSLDGYVAMRGAHESAMVWMLFVVAILLLCLLVRAYHKGFAHDA